MADALPAEFNRRISFRGGGGGGFGGGGGGARGYYAVYPGNYNPAGQWLTQLFPQVPPPPQKPKEPKKPWPEEARKLARSLLRNDQVFGFNDGVRIERQTESFDPRWGQLTGRSQTVTLVSPAAWTTVSASDGSQTVVSGATARSAASSAWLSNLEPSGPPSPRIPPCRRSGCAAAMRSDPLDLAMQGYTPEIKPQDGNRTLLVLHVPKNPQIETQILIDTAERSSSRSRACRMARRPARRGTAISSRLLARGTPGAPKRSTPRAGGPA